MSDGGEVDPTVARLRLCVEQGRDITIEGGGFRLGDDLVVPQVRGVLALKLHAFPEARTCWLCVSPEQKSCVVCMHMNTRVPLLRYLLPNTHKFG